MRSSIARSTHLAGLVDDLLDITRISRGKIRLERRRVELNDLVRRTVDDHRSLFEKDGVRLESKLSPTPVFVSADPTRIAQVVGNLLGNAAKFAGRDGVAGCAFPGTRRRNAPPLSWLIAGQA
jgi:signal transduction histidine kinase